MTETKPPIAAQANLGAEPPSRGAHLFLSRAALAFVVLAVFACAVWIIGYFGWFVVTSVWGDDPDPPSIAFAVGVALSAAGGLLVAASSLVSVLRRLEVLRAERGLARLLRGGWTAGALCAMSGLVVLVVLGVVMVALSKLPSNGKTVVIVIFALCALIPLAPGYEIWRRRAGAKTD